MHTSILRVDVKMMGPASAVQEQNKKQQMQTEIQKIPSDCEERLLHLGGYRVILRVTEHLDTLPRSCEVSFSKDVQNQPGCDPVQPAVHDPALAEVFHGMISRGPSQPQPFCDLIGLAFSEMWPFLLFHCSVPEPSGVCPELKYHEA